MTKNKIKNNNDDVKFIKQVPSHPRDRLAHKARDIYDDMEMVDYNPPPADDEHSGAETALYNIEDDERTTSKWYRLYP